MPDNADQTPPLDAHQLAIPVDAIRAAANAVAQLSQRATAWERASTALTAAAPLLGTDRVAQLVDELRQVEHLADQTALYRDRYKRERDDALQDVQTLGRQLDQAQADRDDLRQRLRATSDALNDARNQLHAVQELTRSTDGDDLDDADEIPVGEIRRVLNEPIPGVTAPVPGSSHARKSPDGDCVYLDVRDGQLTVTQTTGRALALAVNGEWVAVPDRERTTIELSPAGGSQASEPADARLAAPAPDPDPYTTEARLCDDTGMVSDERVAPGSPGTILDPDLTYLRLLNNLRGHTGLPPYEGAPFQCTGSAHLAREHIRCTSPAHTAPKLAQGGSVGEQWDCGHRVGPVAGCTGSRCTR